MPARNNEQEQVDSAPSGRAGGVLIASIQVPLIIVVINSYLQYPHAFSPVGHHGKAAPTGGFGLAKAACDRAALISKVSSFMPPCCAPAAP
jgi:hypothetical protein